MKQSILLKLLWLCLFIILWEAVRLFGDFSPLVYPPLFSILRSLLHAFSNEGITSQLFLSFSIIAFGIAAGIIIAMGAVMAAHSSVIFESFLKMVISIFHPLPGIALLPVLLLWVGTGIESIMIIVLHSVIWPLITNLYTGYKSIPATYTLVADNYSIGKKDRFFRITLPASLPYFLAGSRIAFARAWRALISAEMLFGAAGGTGGIGWFLYNKRVFMDSSGLFAGLLVIVIAGILTEEVFFTILENKTVKKWGMSK
jgi:NitT/TauT family transport system permease protein